MSRSEDEVVSIHGSEWRLADIRDAIAACRASSWEHRQWQRRPALVDRDGTKATPYVGQAYDPALSRVEPEGWDHDHCEICWWMLTDSDDPDRSVGFVSPKETWLCVECYDRFIRAP